ALDAEPEEAIAEAVGLLGGGQVTEKFVPGDVPDYADVRPGRPCRVVLRQGSQLAGLPRLAQHRREDIALPFSLLQHVGELGLVDQQAFVADARVGLHLLVTDRLPPLLDALALHDGVAYGPDEALARRESRLDASARPLVLCGEQEPVDAAPARSFPRL